MRLDKLQGFPEKKECNYAGGGDVMWAMDEHGKQEFNAALSLIGEMEIPLCKECERRLKEAK